MKKFRGTFTVLITPFTADGKKVDEAALRRLVDFQIAEGIHGLIPLGSTGEFLSTTPDERRQVAAAPGKDGGVHASAPSVTVDRAA